MANRDDSVRVKLNIDQEDLRQQVDSVASYMQSKLGKAAADAIKDAMSQNYTMHTTVNYSGGGGRNGGTGGGNVPPTNNGGNNGHITPPGGGNGGNNSSNNTTTHYVAPGRQGRDTSGSTVGSYRERVNAAGGGDFEGPKSTFGNKDFYSALQDVSKNMSTLNSAIRERSRTTTGASRTGRVTYNQNERMQSTKESLTDKNTSGTFANAGETYKRALGGLDANYNDLNSRLKQAQSPGYSGSDDVDDLKLQIKQNQELSNAYQKYIAALNQASDSLGKQDETLKTANGGSGVTVAPKRGSFAAAIQDRSFAIGARMAGGATSAVTNMYTSGKQINQATGQQALEMGTLAGGLNDQQVREQVQGYRGQYGYNTQQGLDFYEQAMRQRGPALTADQAKSRVGAIEGQGRASGLQEQTYSSLVNASAGAGAINSNSDMKSIVQTVLAANEMSGNSGNKEQNAQTLTGLISSIGASRNMNARDIQNTGVTQSALSSAGKSWQGDAGSTNIASMNSSFQAAGRGQNNSLLYLIMRQRGQGGVQGYANAQVQAEKGLSDPSNIKALRQYVNGMARGGNNGKDLARAYLSNSGMAGPEASKELVNDITSGNLSDSEIAKRQREAEKKGARADQQGTNAYNNSQQKVLNRSTANEDRNNSKMASNLNWMTSLGNVATSSLGTAIGMKMVGGVAQQVPGMMGGSLFKAGVNGLGSASGGAGFFSRAASGIKGASSRVFSGVKGVSGKAFSGIKGLFSRGGSAGAADTAEGAARGAEGAASGVEGAASGAAKGAGILSKVGSGAKGILGKAAIPLAIGIGAVDTYHDYKKAKTAKGKEHAVAKGAGKTGGGILGGMAGGAATGAAAGSVVGPLGTAVAGAGGAIVGGIAGSGAGGWIADKAADGWDWITGKDKKKSSKKGSSKKGSETSKQKIATSQSLINQKNQKQMLDQWQTIMDDWKKNIKDTKSANKPSGKATAKGTKSGHAFGGLVTQRTEIAEGDKPEYVVPLDPAKQASTKDALSQITQMTGIRSTDDHPQAAVTQAGAFSPSITINHTGNGGNNDDDVLVTKLNQALKNATDDYRFNFQKG